MQYIGHYESPIGAILLSCGDTGVTGLWFEHQKYFGRSLNHPYTEAEIPMIRDVFRWLDIYFTGRDPGFVPSVDPTGTPFQRQVWNILQGIPYGSTMTYGQVAEMVAARMGRSSMSAQAVGSAIGRNPISLLIPCHRVLGVKGSLTGYAAGIDKKRYLLALEGFFNVADR